MDTKLDTQSMDGRVDGKRGVHPLMVATAIALIVFSAVGVATMTGLLPNALSKNAVESTEPAKAAPAQRATPATPTARPARPAVPATAPQRAMAVAECSDCGVVESVRAVETGGQASGLGAVAGGVLGGVLGNQVGRGRGRTAATVVGAGGGAYAGHEIEKRMNKGVRYQISVRMNDGTYRTFTESNPAFSVGQKVRVSNGGIVAA